MSNAYDFNPAYTASKLSVPRSLTLKSPVSSTGSDPIFSGNTTAICDAGVSQLYGGAREQVAIISYGYPPSWPVTMGAQVVGFSDPFAPRGAATVPTTALLIFGSNAHVLTGMNAFASACDYFSTGTTDPLTLATIFETRGNTFDLIVTDPHDSDPFKGYELYALSNWDGYGAQPISEDTLNAARSLFQMLPKGWNAPAIAPSGDGSIGFEWDQEQGPVRTVFIDIGPGKQWRSYWRKSSGDRGFTPRKNLADTNISDLSNLFRNLSV